MKLKPRQWLGLGAIVVFGGGMIFRLTQPSEREIMEQRLASLPRMEIPSSALEFPIPDLPKITVPELPSLALDNPVGSAPPVVAAPDYASMGSQAAKDDLYCAGILRAHFDPTLKSGNIDQSRAMLEYSRMLAGAGVEKLRAEGFAQDIAWVDFDTAHDAKARADYAANTPRVPAVACEARGKALPADTPRLP